MGAGAAFVARQPQSFGSYALTAANRRNMAAAAKQSVPRSAIQGSELAVCGSLSIVTAVTVEVSVAAAEVAGVGLAFDGAVIRVTVAVFIVAGSFTSSAIEGTDRLFTWANSMALRFG
jgi:hypothetical protein